MSSYNETVDNPGKERLMKIGRNSLLIAVMLALSFGFYLLDYLLFHNLKDTVYYTIQDIAFLPIQVLLVTLILERLLTLREKDELMKKLNMVIGVFFREAGTELIRHFAHFDPDFEDLRPQLNIDAGWGKKQYHDTRKALGTRVFRTDSRTGNLNHLKDFLMDNRDFMLGLMENSNLLENENFSRLLLAVFHVTDELSYRNELGRLSLADLEHLSTDIGRAYSLLLTEWLSYMDHLRTAFPYLYSLAVRMNPFNPDASPEIKKAGGQS